MPLPTFKHKLVNASGRKGRVSMAGKWAGSSLPEKGDKKTLNEMTEERFRDDRRLVMEIELFLSMLSKKGQRPTALSWGLQLDTLQKFPKDARLAQVTNSIRGGYRQLCFEDNLKKYKNRTLQDEVILKRVPESERNIVYDKAF